MSIAYSILASGSSGNSVWVRGGGVEILVDCGLAARNLGRRLGEVGGDLRDVEAVVCTHAHIDHVAGAAVLARRHGLAVHATPATLSRIPGDPPRSSLRPLPLTGTVTIGGLSVHTLATLHDAPESVALVISDGQTRLGIATDLGQPTAALVRALSRVDGLVLEANHDLEMLVTGPYPEQLKRRIRSRVGHLSNQQSAELIGRLLHPGLQHLTLAHLSEQNNLPDKARRAVEPALGGSRVTLAVAEQHRPLAPVALGPGPEPLFDEDPGPEGSRARSRNRCTSEVAAAPAGNRQLSLSYWKP